MQQAVNFNEITKYATSHNSICKVAEAVCALSLVIDDKYTREFKATYLQEFEELNILLLKYVPEVPRAKWYVEVTVRDRNIIILLHILLSSLCWKYCIVKASIMVGAL